MTIDKTVYLTQLFDLYQKLLTEKQREMLSYYYEADYSLAEIADLYHISRQGVYDNIRRGEEALLSYEELLALKEKADQRKALLDQLRSYVNEAEGDRLIDTLKDLI